MSDAPSPAARAGLRVGFAGTPEFAATALKAIHEAGFTVPLVLSQPDRPAGRGMKLQASPVKQLALSLGLPVAQPRSLRLDGRWPEEAQAGRAALEVAHLDVLVVAAYGLILPKWVLDLPKRGCLNIHGSLLPRWRGAAPIHRAIEAGDARTGITVMQMDEGLDTGDMLLLDTVDIQADDTTARLHDRLADLGARLIVQALDALPSETLIRTPQPAEGVTYAHKIDKAESAIDWRLPADLIERRIRAFDPFPGASFALPDGTAVKVWQARVQPGAGEPGRILAAGDGQLVVACGEGALSLMQLQKPGGRRVSARDYLQGAAHWPERLPLPDAPASPTAPGA